MLNKSNFSVEAAVANSGAMEADTISKNVRSSKSQMNRSQFFSHFFLASLVVAVVCMSCGGSSSSKSLSGTYSSFFQTKSVSVIFSGNKIKITAEGENEMMDGSFELVEEYKEDDFSRGKLVVTTREGKNEMDYVLEGKGKILTFNNQIFIKKGTKGSGERLSGTYANSSHDVQTITFTGNKYKWEFFGGNQVIEGIYELFVVENKEVVSKGVISMTNEGGKGYWRYVLKSDEITFNGKTYTKK